MNRNGAIPIEELRAMTSKHSRTLKKARQMIETAPPSEVTMDVMQRLLLLQILPAEGNLTTIRIVRELRERLSFTEDEQARVGFQMEGQNVRWDTKTSYDVPIEIGPVARRIIVAALQALDEAGKVTDLYLPLFDLFGVESED